MHSLYVHVHVKRNETSCCSAAVSRSCHISFIKSSKPAILLEICHGHNNPNPNQLSAEQQPDPNRSATVLTSLQHSWGKIFPRGQILPHLSRGSKHSSRFLVQR